MTRHLLHIGYPKAGSTYLQRWFAAHPQLAYRDGGVAGFHNVYQIARDAVLSDQVPRYFVTSSESLSLPSADTGEMVIDYERRRSTDIAAAQLEVCRTLGELFRGAAVLIITRGYRSMLLSTYSQFVRSGGHLGIDVMLAAARRGELDLLGPWDYDRLLAAYAETFGRDNLVVMPYELLRDDAALFMRTLADRLGIEPLPPLRGRVNESLSPVEMCWYPRFANIVKRVPSRRLFHLYVAAAYRNRLRRPIALLQRLTPAVPVTAAAIPDDIVDAFRGRAESLRGDPLYAAYAEDYLQAAAKER